MASKEYNDSHKEENKQYRLDNIEYIKERNRQHYLDNKEEVCLKTRNNELKRLFGITLKDKQKRQKEQKDLCPLCGKEETVKDHRTGKVRLLAVDHNHTTGVVRDLLCFKCNTAYERYEAYKEQFESYFEKHK
jgi:hypothetical protein